MLWRNRAECKSILAQEELVIGGVGRGVVDTHIESRKVASRKVPEDQWKWSWRMMGRWDSLWGDTDGFSSRECEGLCTLAGVPWVIDRLSAHKTPTSCPFLKGEEDKWRWPSLSCGLPSSTLTRKLKIILYSASGWLGALLRDRCYSLKVVSKPKVEIFHFVEKFES